MELDYAVVKTPDDITHARVRGAPILLCGREVPADSVEDIHGSRFDCEDCRREAELRGDRSLGVVDA